MKPTLLRALALCAALLLAFAPAAAADYLGSDVLGNIGPEPTGTGGLMDRHPLSAFALDWHVDVGVLDLDGVPPTIAHWAAAQLWSVSSFLVRTVIDLFTWAFSLDLLAGDPDRAGDGALAPIAAAIASLYEYVIGEQWMVVAITAAGIWGIWKALIQRRYSETAAGLTVSVVFVVIALFFVYQPERTIGAASRWTNTLSLAFLSGANTGTIDDPEQAKRRVAEQLFDAQIYRPWVVLEFGGLRHCVDTRRRNQDGYPRPVAPHDPAADVCRDHLRAGTDGHGGYAPRFLRWPPGSDERDAEFEALSEGKPPLLDPHFTGYPVDRSDAPAVDIQQAGGAYQRLTLAAIIFLGSLGVVVLLGFLSLAVILAQVVALVLLGFAPVALVVGIFPRGGHEFFRNWLAKLATAVFIKALYSLVIAIVVAVSAALAASTDSLGFLFSFALQGIFFWAVFVYRRQLAARLVAATTGDRFDDHMPHSRAVRRGAHIAAHPFTALASMPRPGGSKRGDRKQESALTETDGASSMPDSAAGTSSGSLMPGIELAGGHAANGSRPARVEQRPDGGGTSVSLEPPAAASFALAVRGNGRPEGNAAAGREDRGPDTQPHTAAAGHGAGTERHASTAAPTAGRDGHQLDGDHQAPRANAELDGDREATPHAAHTEALRRARGNSTPGERS